MAGGRIEIDVVPNTEDFPDDMESGLDGAVSKAGEIGEVLGIALGAGTIGAGLKKTIDIGVEFDSILNQIKGTSRASAEEMQRVSASAKALGNDLSLPGTSASDAAAAMLELSKGGLSVQESMDAAKGSLALAAAAQIDAASAATIQADAINTFNLQAADAGRVADVLANAATASSAEITDIAQGLAQGGAVAQQFGMSIEDTAASLAVLANNGIKGSDAGTLLKSTLLALTDTSNPAQGAIEELGLSVYNAQGQFVGMRDLFGQLEAASKRMTPEMYQQATATLFGSDAMRLAGVAASDGALGFDKMRDAIDRQGSAAELAAAYNEGLPGALEAIGNAAEGAALKLYGLISGPLNALGRGAAQGITEASTAIVGGIESIGAAVAQDDPSLSWLTDGIDDLRSAGENVIAAARPISDSLLALGDSADQSGGAMSVTTTAVSGLTSAVSGASTVLAPVGSLVGSVVSGFAALPGPVQMAALALGAMRLASNRVNTALETRRVNESGRAMNAYGQTVDNNARQLGALGRTYGAVRIGARQFGDEMRYVQATTRPALRYTDELGRTTGQAGRQLGVFQQAMGAYRISTVPAIASTRAFTDQVTQVRQGAVAAGRPIGLLAASMQTLGERSTGALGRMGAAFTTASTSASRLPNVVGAGAAAASGLRSAAGGVVGLLGGPWIAGLTAAMVVGGAWMSNVKAQEQATRQYRAALQGVIEEQSNMNALLVDSRGTVTTDVYGSLTKQVQGVSSAFDTAAKNDAKWNNVASDMVGDVVFAWRGGSDDISKSMDDIALKNREAQKAMQDTGLSSVQVARLIAGGDNAWTAYKTTLENAGDGGQYAAQQLQNLRNTLQSSQELARRLTPGVQDLANAIRVFSDASASAEDKANALKQALDRLYPAADKQEAVARFNDTIRQIAESTGEAVSEADGFGAALIKNGNQLDTTSANGGKLFDQLIKLRDATADVVARGGNLNETWAQNEATLDKLATQFGLLPEQIRAVGESMGLDRTNLDLFVQLKGESEATQGLGKVAMAWNAIPDGQPKTMTIQADELTKEAQDLLARMGAQLSTVTENGVRTVTVNASGDAAEKLNEVLLTVTALPPGKAIDVSVPGGQAVVDLLTSMGIQVRTDNNKNIVVQSPTAPGVQEALKALGISVNTDNNKNILVTDNGTTQTVQGQIDGIHGKTVYIDYVPRLVQSGTDPQLAGMMSDAMNELNGAPPKAAGGPVTGFAAGGGVATTGAVRGPGTGVSDSIDAMVPLGSHVFTAKETEAAGGTSGVMRLLGAAAGRLRTMAAPLVPVRLSNGETVADPSHVEAVGGHDRVLAIRKNLRSRARPQGFSLGGLVNAERVGRENDGLPYITGARDCSMWVSWMVQAAKGQPLQRLFTTYSLLDGQTGGLVPGGSPGDALVVGTSQEHMAATIMTANGPVDTESGGDSSPSQVRWGRGAAGAFHPQFPYRFKLPLELISPPPTTDVTMGDVVSGTGLEGLGSVPRSGQDSAAASGAETATTSQPTIEPPTPPKLEDVAAEAAKIGVRGLLETFDLQDSILADPGRSTVGQAAQIAENTRRYREEQAKAPDSTTEPAPQQDDQAVPAAPSAPTVVPSDPYSFVNHAPYDAGRGTEQWGREIEAALKIVGFALGNKSRMVEQGDIESDGDPLAVGPSSSDGNPEGVWQMKPGTYSAHRDPKLPYDIHNVLSNGVSALNYVKSEYGSPEQVWPAPQGYAAGALRPMAGGKAAVVPPGQLRVIGDRQRDDEFYIPDTDDPNHVALGAEWARRRGFQLVSMHAEGGIAAKAAVAEGSIAAAGVAAAGDTITYKIGTDDVPRNMAAARRHERMRRQGRARQIGNKGSVTR